MAYKTKAYRKTEMGFEPVSRDFISAMSITDQKIYREANKPFYLTPSTEGPELTYNIPNRTFSFYPTSVGKFYGSNEESATHKYCIEEISKLNYLKIKARNSFANRNKDEIINFSFRYILPEIILPIGDKWVKPDLLIYLREPSDLALRWNRLLAVEIVVSHDLDGKKLKLMKDFKIPILRIKANEKWGRKKEENMSEQKKEELRDWIKKTFKKSYTADILLDSKSKAYLENEVIQTLEAENDNLLEQLKVRDEFVTKAEDVIKSLETKLVKTEKLKNHYKESFTDTVKEQGILKQDFQNLSTSKQAQQKNFVNFALLSIVLLAIVCVIIYFK